MIPTLTYQSSQNLIESKLYLTEIHRWLFNEKRECIGKIELGDYFIVLKMVQRLIDETQYQILTKSGIGFIYIY